MTVIAVAGGTGGVGKTIVEKLLESEFDVVVLSRSVKQDSASQKPQNVQINYDDIPSMTHKLEQHNVHTIISAIGLLSDETSQSQLNLIEAAEKSASTKRFIPSEYSFVQTEEYVSQIQFSTYSVLMSDIQLTSLLPIDPSIQYWLDAANRLKASTLQYTRVIPGFFMDYWGMPNVQTHLQPFTFGIDIASGTAAIPGDGNNVICMTYTNDMATYLVKALGLDQWPEFTVIVGDEVTYNQILDMAEEFTGKKFKVTYDSLEKVMSGDVTVPPQPGSVDASSDELKETTALVSRLTVSNVFSLPDDRLNARFPEVKPITMREFLYKAWKGSSA
ncbi:uncharacterized protein N7515_001726 [Penicillium bovifimosum]|uniref:NAD(P)-binding domain-containing protein n=1 Tax=Penicillium bovifimosum TaxID=126998 RepID=A0A9W9HAH7_9EURO|nr:uncharacterized protein N7515_001726 [Penicillium bovifimosum]KAJ5142939.1 hypothetical protein N7515_001726 [Penicillium bovifimosum]